MLILNYLIDILRKNRQPLKVATLHKNMKDLIRLRNITAQSRFY